jgi:cell division protease FtsH
MAEFSSRGLRGRRQRRDVKVEEDKASEAPEIPVAPDTFRKVARTHQADVAEIRERQRMRRLRALLVLNLIILVYLSKRAIDGRPLSFGLPELGPDTMIWLFPLAMLIVIALGVALPFAVNSSSAHVRFSPSEIGITFEDVRGVDMVLEEVTRTLQIFLTYKTFRDELGGNPRRGILFEGRPGTGKTHMAKAMAAEAGVPFYFVSAPAFQSMFYGATARKIRKFFKTLKIAARKEGGAIGFIEEIDAIGGRRGGVEEANSAPVSRMDALESAITSGTEGMVNELLIQLQSFDTPMFWGRVRHSLIDFTNLFLPSSRQIKKRKPEYSNVLIIAATNRAQDLDPALLRPGRFDRTLYFDLPSRTGRRDLIDYFLERRAHAPEMDKEELREELASMTLGYSPAMLEHIVDEALVWALRDGRRELNWRDVQRARLTEEIGLAHPVAYTEREKEMIATHEAGHAVAAFLCASDRKLEVLSIIKRRQALGLLAHSDVEERFTRTKSELESMLKVTMGGLAAEMLFFNESGTGPSSDLTVATTVAAQMVGSFGMGSSLVSYDAVGNSGMHGPNLVAKVLSNDDTKQEVEELLRRHKDQVYYLLENNRDLVEALRDALMEHDELMGDEILAVIEETLERRKLQL